MEERVRPPDIELFMVVFLHWDTSLHGGTIIVPSLQPFSAFVLNQKAVNNVYPVKLQFSLVEKILGPITNSNG